MVFFYYGQMLFIFVKRRLQYTCLENGYDWPTILDIQRSSLHLNSNKLSACFQPLCMSGKRKLISDNCRKGKRFGVKQL